MLQFISEVLNEVGLGEFFHTELGQQGLYSLDFVHAFIVPMKEQGPSEK